MTHRLSVVAGEVAFAAALGWVMWQDPRGRAALIVTAAVWAAATWVRRRRRRHASRGLDGLLAMDGSEFEHAVAGILERAGWRDVAVSGGPGDLQADVTGYAPDGRYGIVQCKRYARSRKLGSPLVQTVLGVAHRHHEADLCMIATTTTFTGPARRLAERHGVVLLDGDTIAEASTTGRLPAF